MYKKVDIIKYALTFENSMVPYNNRDKLYKKGDGLFLNVEKCNSYIGRDKNVQEKI